MENSVYYTDRIERQYQVGISESDLPALWRDVSRHIPLYEFTPGQQITWVNSVYFDNKNFELLRYNLLSMNDYIHVRLRTYEYDCYPPEPISTFWMEMKVKKGQVRRKKRFSMPKEALGGFLGCEDVEGRMLDYTLDGADPEITRKFYQEIRNTIFRLGLKPTLLVTYKRVAFQNESERLSLDWDIRYYHVGTNVYHYPSWKDIGKTLGEKANKILLELKYPQGAFPVWVGDLQRSYPLSERRYYSKFNEGMSFLFPGLFKQYAESNYFLQMIKSYTEDWKTPLERYG